MVKQSYGNSPASLGSISTGAIALALMALLLPACQTTVPEAEENVTAEDVAEETDDLLGQEVTVRSEVVEKVGPAAFTISDEEFLSGESILVLNASGEPSVLPEDTELQVTGKVAKFVVADIERDYDLDLDEELYVEYEDKPALIAQSIALAPEVEEVAENPTAFYNQTIAVKGEVEEIVSPTVFRMDENDLFGDDDLLVLVANPTRAIQEDEEVVATGVLRSFVLADIERDYDLTWDLDLQKKLEAEYTQKPVLVVNDVYPSALPEVAK
ncbi:MULTISPECIES: hypothetical protein [unclassified Coleofasciculus]|uniref:hypothetical protein n=1 Tax=unclassified Coleofasciculus TaxID=2692782 RepID=UPI00187E1096|nr:MULTISPECIES: hypothetical protein [unclassified Coleofasciculus]MBE9128290.1 hypothetical protein [Coleofasciculus sp. LEGE 07081]MBE9151342.1 hypothetical protein [Coleofasciculus sp. LEGE 07092]